jgi:uncharacterized protein (DUF1810 family)
VLNPVSIRLQKTLPETVKITTKPIAEAKMAIWNESVKAEDPYNLARFVQAQETSYSRALGEIQRGRKCSHWMWYIFPQFDGLGFSSTTKHYAIKSIAEARAYLNDPVLGPRLVECAEAALAIEGRSAFEIFDAPDDLKLKSCATLFAYVSPAGSVFEQLLEKFFPSGRDSKTLQLLEDAAASEPTA